MAESSKILTDEDAVNRIEIVEGTWGANSLFSLGSSLEAHRSDDLSDLAYVRHHLGPDARWLPDEKELWLVEELKSARQAVLSRPSRRLPDPEVAPFLLRGLAKVTENSLRHLIYQMLLLRAVDQRFSHLVNSLVVEKIEPIHSEQVHLLMLMETVRRITKRSITEGFDYGTLHREAVKKNNYNAHGIGMDYRKLCDLKIISEDTEYGTYKFSPEGRRIMELCFAEMAMPWDMVTESEELIREYDFFLSHSRDGAELVGRLKEELVERKQRCFIASHDIKIADDWLEVIRQALHVSERVVVILTPDAIGSRWVQVEVDGAWVLGKTICPVLAGVSRDQLYDPMRACQGYPVQDTKNIDGLVEDLLRPLKPRPER
jgi:hypothetical protein